MGRKIPGRKHRGIRDPEKQAAARFESIKDKINAPPSHPDEQQVSKTLQKVIDLKNKVKTGGYNKKLIKKLRKDKQIPELKFKAGPNMMKPEKSIPNFRQFEGESDRDFISRMNRICMNVTKEAQFEERYGVEIQRNEDGEVEAVVKRPKDELEIILKKAKKDKDKKKKNKKKTEETDSPRLTKWQKRQRKLKEKKLKKELHNVDEFKTYKDQVKFGEIVHAPPTLVTPRKISKQQSTQRPGTKNLLLKSMIQAHEEPKSLSKPKESIEKTVKIIDRKGKRKDLPNALRRQLDKQQQEIIGAYKQLKAKKYRDKV